MNEWNEWAEKNQNNRKFKVKKYRPAAKTLPNNEDIGGIEAMRFLHMYRNNQRGDIGDKMDLFKEFFLNKDQISRTDFERLASVWLKRYHYEQVTGQKYISQEHVYKALKRQNARKFANEEIRSLPMEMLIDEINLIFPDTEKQQFSLVETVHWLVDGNLYGQIGLSKMKEIFDDYIQLEKQKMQVPFEDSSFEGELIEGKTNQGNANGSEDNIDLQHDEVNKIDL